MLSNLEFFVWSAVLSKNICLLGPKYEIRWKKSFSENSKLCPSWGTVGVWWGFAIPNFYFSVSALLLRGGRGTKSQIDRYFIRMTLTRCNICLLRTPSSVSFLVLLVNQTFWFTKPVSCSLSSHLTYEYDKNIGISRFK